jgi:N-acetylglutamate synthase-like GNAT family acetyltransferase
MINLRPAQAIDATFIRTLIRAYHLNPFGLDWRRFIIAEQNIPAKPSERVGCVQIKPHTQGSNQQAVLELASLAVVPDRQGQGIGEQLVAAALAASSPHPLYLMCAGRLQPYYERFGFTPLPLQAMPPYFRRIAFWFNLGHTPQAPLPRLAVLRAR